MNCYEDMSISEMLREGNFSEQIMPSEKVLTTNIFMDGVDKDTHFGGEIFKVQKPCQSNLSQAKQGFDFQEFFPPSKCVQKNKINSKLDSSSSKSSQNTESKYQTFDQAQSSEKNQTVLSKNYAKNISGYIVKKSIGIMFTYFRKLLIQQCKKLGIKYKQFENYYKDIKIYGPKSFVDLFKIDENDPTDVKMKALFKALLVKIIRKRYLLYTIKLGKMQAKQSYITQKNRHLLYFADQLQNVLKNSGF